MRQKDDLISRQAAIMETWREPRYTDPLNVLTEIRDRLRSLPSAEPHWIPVSERLPEIIKGHYVSDVCIVYCDTGAYGFTILEENIFGQVGWQCERDDDYHEPLGEVIAWMPLPEPPKMEGEQDG